jgi:hypothetical protein
MLSRLKKLNTVTNSGFKCFKSNDNIRSALKSQESAYICKTEVNTSPEKLNSKRDRRGSHKVDQYYNGLKEVKLSKFNTDTQITKLQMMKKMATKDLKLIKEKKLLEKKSSSTSTKSLKHTVSPFMLEEKSVNKLLVYNEDKQKQLEIESKLLVVLF